MRLVCRHAETRSRKGTRGGRDAQAARKTCAKPRRHLLGSGKSQFAPSWQMLASLGLGPPSDPHSLHSLHFCSPLLLSFPTTAVDGSSAAEGAPAPLRHRASATELVQLLLGVAMRLQAESGTSLEHHSSVALDSWVVLRLHQVPLNTPKTCTARLQGFSVGVAYTSRLARG